VTATETPAQRRGPADPRPATADGDPRPATADRESRPSRRHLLSVGDLGPSGIGAILRLADRFAEVSRRPIPKVPALRGRTVATVFAESSTRTRLSFETAARRLSADVLTFTPASSSLAKGESLRDTVATVTALGVDGVVVRHGTAGVPWQVARWTSASVVNAGDGWHEHPTQALLDCATVRQVLADRHGVAVEDTGTELFAGLRVAIVGDIRHSRVARSVSAALGALGCRVTLVGPGSLLPTTTVGWPIERSVSDLDAVLPETDVCYLLRLQTERGAGAFVPSMREYHATFGLTEARAARLPDHAVVLHPGPMVRGVEIADAVADDPRCLVLDQVRSGVAVRMAVLFWLVGTDGEALDG
jgi:aspartate carbamoyltransferase catalytic subunit